MNSSNPVKITDTTLRDAHQSLAATRMRLSDMEPIAAAMDEVGFWSLEVWGGATFDVTTRFLAEDPWDRVRTLKKLAPKTPLQMLLRGQNLVGYRNYPDDVVDAFIDKSAEVGIDIFRVFDALNDERNFETAAKAIKRAGKHFQGTICYSVTGPRMGGDVYNLDYFIDKARILEQMDADSLCLKDMAGLLSPYDAYQLVSKLKETVSMPIHLHTHYTSGMASMTVLKAIEAGIDIVDTCLSPFALRTSQPAIEPLLVSLQDTERSPGIDLDNILKLGDYFESIAPKYKEHFDTTRFSVIDTNVLSHQIPGGMASNLTSQLKEADALDRIDEVYKELPRIRKELGYPPLVTPTSQIVGVQAVLNVLFGRYEMVSGQVKDYVFGLYGKPPREIDQEVTSKVLKDYDRGQNPVSGRAADYLEPEMEQAIEDIKHISSDMSDVLTYALYPVTGLRFLKWKYGLEPLPDEMQPHEPAPPSEDSQGDKAAPLQHAPNVTPPASSRLFNVYLGSEVYQVAVEPVGDTKTSLPLESFTPTQPSQSSQTVQESEKTIDPLPESKPTEAKIQTSSASGTKILAPMPGILLRYGAEIGAHVKKGDAVLYLEAMKMENAIPSPIDGIVKEFSVLPGNWVAKNDVLAVIE
ncbi:MAG: pyruvate carboxylase subunit B [SAR202 cluster bacterium]|nr:pyruvate carboxylase subunit B [SAR202 cluster bacterium]|tara:strand:+ start:7266 stop:9176 length:1911 start_codon:yes stop_codon:yes gene_type:complete